MRGGGAVRFRPDTKSGGEWGGGGVLPASGPIQKAGGGGAVRFNPDTKSGEGGWGGAVHLRKSGGGGGAVQRIRPDTKSREGGGAV